MTSKWIRFPKHFSNGMAVLLAASLFFCGICASTEADEIRINENSSETVAGDFRCKPCNRPIIYDADTIEMGTQAMTTGDLFRYFESRGIKKIDRLSLQVDVDCCAEEDQAFQLNGLNFKITGDDNTVLNEASLQNDSLLVAGAEISSFKPEAVLEFDLGYNFMERFSSDSTDLIELSYALPAVGSDKGGMTPRFVVSEDISSFSASNMGILGMFVGFWVVVFLGMNLFIKPKSTDSVPAAEPTSLVGG